MATYRENYPDKYRRKSSGSSGLYAAAHAVSSFDGTLVFVTLFLCAFGLVMLFSTSSYEAQMEYGDSAYYLKKQAFSIALGIIGMLIVAHIRMSVLHRLQKGIYIISFFLVILVRFIGTEVNGAKRWLRFGPVSIQPSEISKIAVILTTAAVICMLGREIQTFRGWCIALVPGLIQAGAIQVLTSNMSSAILIMGIAFFMATVASTRYRYMIIAFIAVAILAAAYIAIVLKTGGEGMDYHADRILAWLDPSKYSKSGGFQTMQALYGIGSGGFFGKGLGQSVQKLGTIPEAQNDMIFSIICEELGLFGALSIIFLFVVLAVRMYLIARATRSLYSALIVIGVMTQITLQALLNIAVVTNISPNTGVTLPFISYGGTSVSLLLVEVGMVLSVDRINRKLQNERPQSV